MEDITLKWGRETVVIFLMESFKNQIKGKKKTEKIKLKNILETNGPF